MPIDKENAPLIKAHIHASYGPTLERTLLTFILQDLAEIMASMQLRSKANLTFEARMRAREEVLHSPQIKRSLMVRLNALKCLRYQIAQEVIKQYNLNLPNDEVSFYQDVMEEYLARCEVRLESWIMGGVYDEIHHRLNQLTVH